MLLVIDESGDLGFKTSSSEYFALGALFFDTYRDAEILSKKVTKLKNKLNDRREFKFSSTDSKRKINFFNEISDCNFQFRAVYINKEKIIDKSLKRDSKEFYYYTLRLLIQGISSEVYSIKIDNLGNKLFKTRCAKICGDFFPNTLVKFVDSASDNLIQTSDMLLGITTQDKFDSTQINNIEKLKEKLNLEIF
jgi:hypothetical protein